jgi:hypothetical protein
MQNVRCHLIHGGPVFHGANKLQDLSRWLRLQWFLCSVIVWSWEIRGGGLRHVLRLWRYNKVQHGRCRGMCHVSEGIVHNGRIFCVDANCLQLL